MMRTAVPVSNDPSQIHLTMPAIPPSPIRSKSRLLEIIKLLIGLLIALILAAILAVLVFVPHTSNEIDLRESNENIAKLARESNENIARLQREQELYIENEHQKRQENLMQQQLQMEMQRLERQENLTEKHRLEDRFIEQQYREQDQNLSVQQTRQQLQMQIQRLEGQENLTEKHRLEDRFIEQQYREQDQNFSMEQTRQQLLIEERRWQLSLEEQLLAEEHRKEDLSRGNAELLSNFMESITSAEQPLNASMFQLKVHSLIRQFDPIYKSLLINYLYKVKLLNTESSDSLPLDLEGTNLKEIDLDGIDVESGQVGLWLNYTKLALPLTNLINTSFEHIYLNEANFSMSNMMGASFHWSTILRANFERAILSLSNFQYANVSQSNFSYSKIQRASFQNANLTQTNMDYSDLTATNFQYVIAIETNFTRSEMSDCDFQYADLSRAQMRDTSIRSANFYDVKAIQTDFTNADLPGCSFRWADLRDASFKNAFLAGASFDNANVENVDFTRAFLAGANITAGQLDVVLSISQAVLPDGSMRKNKNLVKNGDAQCTGSNGTVLDWPINENVFTDEDSSSTDCAFQATTVNATLEQIIDIRRYQRLNEDGQGKVYMEMEDKTTNIMNPSVYMIIRFFDSANNQIGGEQSSLNITSATSTPKFSTTLPCPSNTVELQLSIVFREVNATVDNIYVTIEF